MTVRLDLAVAQGRAEAAVAYVLLGPAGFRRWQERQLDAVGELPAVPVHSEEAARLSAAYLWAPRPVTFPKT